VAVNCSVRPTPKAADGFGVTTIDISAAGLTVSIAGLLVTPAKAALMFDVPTARVDAEPALLIVATAVADETQVALAVKFAVVASVYVPVAVNCCVRPFAIDVLAGVTAIDTRVGAVTVSVAVLLVTPLDAAVMFDVPRLRPVATPELLIVAVPVTDEFHVAVPVRSAVVESVYVPVAVNCCVRPFAIIVLAGVTAIDTSVAAVTVSVAVLLVTPLDAAVMFEAPRATPVAKPELVIVAIPVADEFHVALAVKSAVLESVYVPVAVNCCVRPFAIVALAGVTAIDTRVGAVTVSIAVLLATPAIAALIFVAPAVNATATPKPLIVATPVTDELHVAVPVKFVVLESV
jgi:hypothetical protein